MQPPQPRHLPQPPAAGLPHALLAKGCLSAGRAPASSWSHTSQMNKNLPRAVCVPAHSFACHIRVAEGFFSTLARYRTVSMRLV